MQYLNTVLRYPPVRALVGYFLCMALLALMIRLILKPLSYWLIGDVQVADTVRITLGIAWLLLCYYWFVRYVERRKATELDIVHWKTEIIGGAAVGFTAISLCILTLYGLGNYHYIDSSFTNYSTKLFVTLLLAALIEDLLTRGLILRILEQWLGSYRALILTLLVEALHFSNDNIEVDAMGIALFVLWGANQGLMYIYTKRIWLPFAFHVGWNFAQPFYGSNLTGLDDMGKITNANFVGSEFLTGGAIGIEGSVFTLVVLLVSSTTLLYLAIKQNKIVRGNVTWLSSVVKKQKR